ncbi:MAG: ABC transporter permease [Tissierellia bacterium]|nr:ABC transporter permease [Tissierellia bacterium]
MLLKLSYRNAKRTFDDYLIYLITLSLAISMEFAMNRTIFLEEIQEVSSVGTGFSMMLLFASIFMMFVVALMIKYMVRFIVERRSSEFGLYLLMGIEQKNIKKMFWLEQVLLCVISLVIGMLFGLLLGEILKVIVFNLMGLEYSFTLSGLINSILITILVTICAYGFAYLFSRKLFNKNQIIDWLDMDRQNEKQVSKSLKSQYIILTITTIGILTGLGMMYYAFNYFLSIWLLNIGILILVLSLYGVASTMVLIFNKVLLRGNKKFTSRVLPIRFIGGRVNTMSRQMGTLAILFVLSITMMSVGILFVNYYKSFVGEYESFDLVFMNEYNDSELAGGIDEITKKYDVSDKVHVPIYEVSDSEVYKIAYEEEVEKYPEEYKNDIIVPLSSYNEMRRIAGYDVIDLADDEFLLQSFFQMQSIVETMENDEYYILNKEYKLKEKSNAEMNTSQISNYYIVLNHSQLENLEYDYTVDLWNLGDYDYATLNDELLEYTFDLGRGYLGRYSNEYGLDSIKLDYSIMISQAGVNEMLVSLTASSLSIILIGLIFVLVMCTLISMNLVSEIKNYKVRYDLLSKLGLSERNIKKLIWQQVMILFLFPLILGLPVASGSIYIMNTIFKGIMSPEYLITNFMITIAVFIGIYLIYMFATYKTYENAIIE